MKITYLANLRIPTQRAHGYAIMKMCEQFVKQGVEVELVAPNKKDSIGINPFDYYGLERNFKIRRLLAFDFLGRLRFGKRFFFWLDLLFFYFVFMFSWRSASAKNVYTRDYFLAFLLPPERYSVFLELHDLPKTNPWFKRAVKKAKKIIVISRGLRDDLKKIGVAEEKILVAPDAVDLEKFDVKISQEEARQKMGLPNDKKIIMYAGHLYGWKGADVLADAAAALAEHLVVFIGGIGSELDNFEKKHKNRGNIKIIPFQARERMPFYLKAADVLVLPNKKGERISEKYTSPLKLFEYMASGAPIVASDLPSIREALDENSAVLVEPNNPEELAMGINKILNNETLGNKIAESALEAVKNYTWEKRAENILEFIKR